MKALVLNRYGSGGELAELADYVTSGAVTPVVDRVYPLEDAVAAFRDFAVGRACGKIVIAPQPD